jgi:hypothetical protein
MQAVITRSVAPPMARMCGSSRSSCGPRNIPPATKTPTHTIDQRRNHGYGQAELTEQHVDEHCGNTEGQRMIHDAACANQLRPAASIATEFGRGGYLAAEASASFGTSTVSFSSAR